MTDKIELKNLSVTKINESETETEDGTKTVYTYTLGNDDVASQFVWKTSEDMGLRIGQRFTITMFNPQTQLELEEETEDDAGYAPRKEATKDRPDFDTDRELENEAEAILEAVERSGKTDQLIEEIKKRPALAKIVQPELDALDELKVTEEKKEKRTKKKSVSHNNTAPKEGGLEITINDVTLDPSKKPMIEKMAKDAAKEFVKKEAAMEKVEKAKKSTKEPKETKKEPKKIFTFGEPEEPRRAEPIGEKTKKTRTPVTPETKEKCKFHYRGGLCANSALDHPFCDGVDKCKHWHPELDVQKETKPKKKKGTLETPTQEEEPESLPKVAGQGELGRNGFKGLTYEYPVKIKGETVTRTLGVVKYGEQYMAMWKGEDDSYHRIKSKALDPRETEELAQIDLEAFAGKKKLKQKIHVEDKEKKPKELRKTAIKPENKTSAKEVGEQINQKERKLHYGNMVGAALILKDKMPDDILGGLQEDVRIEYNDSGGFLYCHAKSVDDPDAVHKDAKDIFVEKLEKYSGMKWKHVYGRTFAVDKEQINKEEEE